MSKTCLLLVISWVADLHCPAQWNLSTTRLGAPIHSRASVKTFEKAYVNQGGQNEKEVCWCKSAWWLFLNQESMQRAVSSFPFNSAWSPCFVLGIYKALKIHTSSMGWETQCRCQWKNPDIKEYHNYCTTYCIWLPITLYKLLLIGAKIKQTDADGGNYSENTVDLICPLAGTVLERQAFFSYFLSFDSERTSGEEPWKILKFSCSIKVKSNVSVRKYMNLEKKFLVLADPTFLTFYLVVNAEISPSVCG